MEVPALDRLDRRILHALWVAPRASWRELAAAVGTSDQTVARRYRALVAETGLRITARLDAGLLGWETWLVRLQCTPDAAGPVAEALASRADTAWVRLAAGGTEVICGLQTRTAADRDALLLERLTGSRRVVGISAHLLLHVFSPDVWAWVLGALDPDEVAALTGPADRPPAPTAAVPVAPVSLEPGDHRLVALLQADGRMSAAALAAETGWHESRVRRRIAQLEGAGVLQFDLDIDERALGLGAFAQCWVTVEPHALAATGAEAATHPQAAFVASYTGPANLLVSVTCVDSADLYAYLTDQLGQIPAVRAIETVPVLRVYKRTAVVRRR